jgi:hypothetical protein
MFTTGEDRNLELLTRGPAPRHPALVYEIASYYLADPSTSGGACSGLNPHVGSYCLSAMTSQGLPIGKIIFQSSTGTSSSSSLGVTPDRDSIEDYPKIGGSAYENPAIKAHRINMVGPARANSQNSSSRYATIWGSDASDARTPSNRVIQNLNPKFNVVKFQTIMESIQQMVPHDSPLVTLAQQGAEVVGNIIAMEHSARNHQGEPSVGNRSADRAKRARSEEASSASGNRRLADNDAR